MGRAMSKEEAGAGGQLLLCLLCEYHSSPDVEQQIEDGSEKEAERERQQRDVSDRRVLPTVARSESSCVFYKSHVCGHPCSVAGSGFEITSAD